MIARATQFAPMRVTSCGMVSSLGDDVATCCAAARAGLVRSRELTYALRTTPDATQEMAIGHPAALVTHGFEHGARLTRLLQGALRDLERSAGDRAPFFDRRTAFYLALPDAQRFEGWLPLIHDEEERESLRGDLEEDPPPDFGEESARTLLEDAATWCGWPNPARLAYVATSGNTGFARALAKASVDLAAQDIDVAIVGAVDSLLDDETLDWLGGCLRLKSESAAAGMQPGEAAVLIAVERRERSKSGDEPEVLIDQVALGESAGSQLEGEASLGEGLSSLMQETAPPQKAPAWILADQNGESYRAMEWGCALHRLAREAPELSNPEVWYPAASFGDVGSVQAAAGLCLARHAFLRNCAPNSKALILSSADSNERSAIVLTCTIPAG